MEWKVENVNVHPSPSTYGVNVYTCLSIHFTYKVQPRLQQRVHLECLDGEAEGLGHTNLS